MGHGSGPGNPSLAVLDSSAWLLQVAGFWVKTTSTETGVQLDVNRMDRGMLSGNPSDI